MSDQPNGGSPPDEAAPKIRSEAVIRGNSDLYNLVRGARGKETPEVSNEYVLQRDDNRPLKFVGTLVGTSRTDPETPRGTSVCLFLTKAGKIITAVHQWQRVLDHDRRQRHAAAIHTTVDEAFRWLLNDSGGHLGPASREAWEMACEECPAFLGHDCEVIE